MISRIFKNKKPNYKKLTAFGFEEKLSPLQSEKSIKKYIYNKELCELGMRLEVIIEGEKISANIFDPSEGEEYILHLTDAEGSFVGRVG